MIKGKIVGLRAIEKEDLPLLRDWRNLSSFRTFFREIREISLTDQEEWFNSLQNTKEKNFMFGVVDLGDNNLIGACGLLYINWIIRSADFSFYIGKDESYIDKDGFALEASRLLIDYGFKNLNLNKIWMELYEYDNMKLEFFMNSYPFKQDGILRENCYENGRYWNSIIISLLRKEYNAKE